MREATVDRERRSLLTGRLNEIRGAETHVVSLVVYADPSRASEISDAVGRLPGAEVHANDGRGKLVVVLEAEGSANMAAAIDRVDRMAGVICTALVFQQAESFGADV
ncbi:MAG: chaperone NapD [Alphaproteobacteria bacterium]|jgi:nitrate reductase NapD|nr:chaperone NapD [Alphaproteobacteria bacterium]